MKKMIVTFTLNDQPVEVLTAPNRTLLQLLREDLNLTGTKCGCNVGDCGSCTVIMEDKPVNSCLVLAGQLEGRAVTTIEGVAIGDELHPVQDSFVEKGAIQCGFCTPGMILSGKALLDRNPDPTELEIRTALSGNLCRCTGYQKIVEAVSDAAEKMNDGERSSS